MESSLLPCFRQLSLDSPSSGLMRHSLLSQVNGYEEVVSNEGEDDNNQDCEDATNDLYVSPSNLETISDPYIATFLNNLSQDEDAGLVASFQRICYFNGADSYAILHRGNHIQPVSQNIAYISELWLAEKLSHTGETIPILEESPQVSAESIMSKLREVASVLNGLGKVLINIRAGHAYLLNMIGDEIVMDPNYERFFQQFPLFLNLSIKVQSHLPSTRHNACQVLVAVEHVTIKDQTTVDTDDMEDTPCKFSHQHYQAFDDSFETSRATFSPDGQTFCLLEEIPTNFW